MAVIYPERGKAPETARLLLELADSPYQVQTDTTHGLAFVVPDELADKYLVATGHDPDGSDEEAEPETPVKRRPGRPRKVVPATVEPDTEEE